MDDRLQSDDVERLGAAVRASDLVSQRGYGPRCNFEARVFGEDGELVVVRHAVLAS